MGLSAQAGSFELYAAGDGDQSVHGALAVLLGDFFEGQVGSQHKQLAALLGFVHYLTEGKAALAVLHGHAFGANVVDVEDVTLLHGVEFGIHLLGVVAGYYFAAVVIEQQRDDLPADK